MAHEIDTTTGNAAVFVTGEAAWHRLGAVVSQAQTSADAIKLAHLDWRVIQCPVAAKLPDGQYMPTEEKLANVRSDTKAVLGVVGRQYRVFQNADAFDFMDAIVDDKLAMFETAGAIHGGKRVWMMARIPKELRVSGTDDVIHPYVLLTNSHDGTTALRMVATTVRVVCQNTLNLALREAGTTGLAIRHCDSLGARVTEARKNLGIIARRVGTFQEELDALARVSLKETQVKDYFRGVFDMKSPKQAPAPNGSILDTIISSMSENADIVSDLLAGHKEQSTRKEKADARLLEQLLTNFADKTNVLPGIKGTAWAAYNAVSEYVDHQSRSRDDNTRLNSIWFGSGDQIKQQAYSAALALAQ